ncbi:MAG: ArdC family protein [Devosia sp.]
MTLTPPDLADGQGFKAEIPLEPLAQEGQIMTTTQTTPRRDIHAEITNQLISAIEANPGQFCLPWRRGNGALHMPVNALTGNRYNGINILSLWVAAEVRGFTAPIWGTYRQWAERGAQVRKGEKSSLVVFYKEYETDPEPDNADDTGKRRMARASYVFNAAQVDGFDLPAVPQTLGPVERIGNADRFVTSTGARVAHGGDRAFYRPSTDSIQMPDEGLFTGTGTMTRSEGYYATMVHELVHWSGAKHRKRCERSIGRSLDGRYFPLGCKVLGWRAASSFATKIAVFVAKLCRAERGKRRWPDAGYAAAARSVPKFQGRSASMSALRWPAARASSVAFM